MDVENREQFEEGKKQIAEVATRYAGQHGLTPREIRWDERGFDLMLIFETDSHQVDIPPQPRSLGTPHSRHLPILRSPCCVQM